MSDHPPLLTQVKHAYEIHDVERRPGRELHPGWAPDRELAQSRLLVRRKKLDRGEHPGTFHVPGRLLGLGSALVRVVAAPIKLGLPMLSADPLDLAPERRLGDQPDNLGVPANPAAAARDSPAPERHPEFCARRVPRPRLAVAESRGVPPPGGDLPAMLVAPAPDRGGVAGGAMPAARTRPAPAAGSAAEANEGQRRRQGDVVELIDWREFTHESPFAAVGEAVLSHTLTYLSCLRRTPSQAQVSTNKRRKKKA
jgi:hypothetical protein